MEMDVTRLPPEGAVERIIAEIAIRRDRGMLQATEDHRRLKIAAL
jgi:hypothetical protein